ncbi:MAG: DUF3108 domain-containing protein [Muribaculaceae bacterium]|nr:DUF3108 domain-containing protein [Muribaculaceae bacterium]
MRRFILAFSGFVFFAASAVSATFQPESLHYKVMYKWGLINKKAGTATLTLRHAPQHYVAQLTAASEPWADRIYQVRDTLNGHMAYADMTPLFYEKIANEGNEHKHDIVRYDYSAMPSVKADCTRKVYKKGILRIDDSRQLDAKGEVVDMLTSFYFMRNLPYQDWEQGHVKELTIFSGKQKEKLTIKYEGIDNLDFEGACYKTFHIKFMFTSKGGRKSSDDMEAWISADKRRIPLRLEGKLPVGKVHCIFTGAD